MSATKRQDLPLPETRRVVSYALRALELWAKLTPHEMIEAGSILSTLIQVEIARRNEASKQAQQRSRVPVDEEYPG